MNDRVGRAAQALHECGIEAALLSSPANVCYVSGYAVPIETGLSPFAGAPALALLAGGRVTLIVQDGEEAAARAAGADHVATYPAFGYRERYDQLANAWEALRAAMHSDGLLDGPLGVEPAWLPLHIVRGLQSEFPGVALSDASGTLAGARLVKSASELALLRRAIGLTDVGQDAARRLVSPGVTEVELFAGIRAAIESEAGCRLPLACDVVAGADRTAAVGGWPTGRAIGPRDLVLVDLGPRWGGYWGDSCNTLCAGEPSDEHRRMIGATREALARTVEAVRPGLAARDLDAICRGTVERHGYAYPHHTGHGLGTTVHEDPRIVPYESMRLQAGMVIALEPGAYVPGVGGVRTEHVVLVTGDGCEVLSRFRHGL